MTRLRLIDQVLAAQAPNGAFLSRVHFANRSFDDHNVFVTALVLRSLAGAEDAASLCQARERALDFLEASESREIPGSFGFWPATQRPDWAPRLPEDADDTAIVALELFRYGRRDLNWLRRVACRVLLPNRLKHINLPAPPWIGRGVFLTWLRPARANCVDCCVNANVAALFSAAGLAHLSAFVECVSMIDRAVAWADDSYARLRSLAPFYAHPCELSFSVAHAVSWGVARLAPVLRVLQLRPRCLDHRIDPDRPVCSDAYGRIVWTAPILQLARSLNDPTERFAQ